MSSGIFFVLFPPNKFNMPKKGKAKNTVNKAKHSKLMNQKKNKVKLEKVQNKERLKAIMKGYQNKNSDLKES